MPNLFIDVEARFAKFQDSLDAIARKATQAAGQMDKAFGVVKGTLATLGVGLSVAAIKSFVQGSIDAADHLNALSKQTGIAVETLGGLGLAAQRSGSSLEGMATAAGHLNRSIAEAGAGNDEKAQAFAVLGISVRDAAGNLKSADAIMAELADRFESYEDGPNKVALAIKLLGKSGAELIPTLNEGGAKLRENIAYFERYSGVTKDVAERADEFNGTLVKLNLLSGALGTKIASELLDPLQSLAEHLLEAKEQSKAFETGARGVAATFAAIAVAVYDLAKAYQVTGSTLKFVYDFFAEPDIDKSTEIWKKYKKEVLEAAAALKTFEDRMFQKGKFAPDPYEVQDRESGRGITANRTPKKQAPSLPDSGAAGKADAARKALDALTEARSKIAVDAEKLAATNRLAILDHFYKEGYAGEERYWQVRGEIQKSAYDIERRALDESVTSRQAALDNAVRTKGKGSKDYYDALKDLAEAQAKRNTLDAQFNAQGNADVLARAKATADYERAIKNVNLQLEELRGNTAAAAAGQFDLQNEQLRGQAEGRGDTAGVAALDNLRAATAAQAQFNELKERANQVTERLALQEERIQNAVRVGAISELEALRQTEQARRNALQTLGITHSQLDQLAASSGLEKLRLDAEKFGVSLETLASQSNLLGDRYKKVFEDSFGDEFAKIIDGTQKVGDAFKNMGKRIISELANIQARSIATSISNAAKGAFDGGGFGDILKRIFGGGSDPGLAGPSEYGVLTAYGGRRSAGQPLIVGEAGRELWIPDTPGTMVPNNMLRDAGGDISIVNHFDNRGADPIAIARLEAKVDQQMRVVYQNVRDAQRRRVGS